MNIRKAEIEDLKSIQELVSTLFKKALKEFGKKYKLRTIIDDEMVVIDE